MSKQQSRMTRVALLASVACISVTSARAQQAAEPAAQGLPEVQVIQKKAPAAKKAAPVAKQVTSPAPTPPPAMEPVVDDEANSPYGSPASAGAKARAEQSAQTPVNPTQLVPENLDGFSAAATNLSPDVLTERQPRNVNEALTRVPGVTVINDDAAAHHGGIAVRGSPGRRSRKMLVMEDGHAVNLALWLDPSVHYWAPIERMESIEVIRGTVITHGPNNNFGVINSRNLSPFGPDETVISSAIGFTKTRRGSFQALEGDGPGSEPEPDGAATSRGDDNDFSATWHVHTRQHADNVGLVASYTGHNMQGAWDTERLRVHDFYGALGWKGSNSDVVVSLMHAQQDDNYDEQNFLGNYELGEFGAGPHNDAEEEAAEEAAEELVEEQFLGLAEQQFKQLKHCKTCFAPGAGVNTYTGEIWRGQIVHNAYLDDDTTITSRVYAGYHRRDRYQLNTYESDPDGTPGDAPVFDPAAPTLPNEESDVFFGENTMFGRLRTFRHVGGEVRGEWANQKFLGFNQDVQAGVRYEYQDMTNRNFLGRENEILEDGDEAGATIFDRSLDANTVSAFLQTNVYVAKDFNVIPGIRFEWLNVSRRNRVIAREESEAGGGDEDDCQAALGVDDCLELDGILLNPSPASESFSSFNALPGIAFAYTGLNRTTIFGGYHRGLTTQVLRNEDFPGKDEIGDNFNLGLRTSAVRGLDFEVAGFYQLIENYQYGASFSNVAGDRSFGTADEVEISGVELHGRLNSQPYTGGSLNFFAEAGYTYSRGVFKDLEIEGENFDGNRIPEVPLHVAALTLGIEQNTGWRWDASVTWTYRGAFFTDEGNTPLGAGGEVECEEQFDGGGNPDGYECEFEEAGEDGEVPEVWLLSARFNMDLGNSGASVFLAGENLLDEFYISDREDGMKPGIGRTLWTGFKYKF
ncbi:MAG: TonB-dependent receptor family protein [Hyphomicrobium sp.]|uniref:TonB-dependent receptor family protein n=1 Tax=Hyphomicrobium sp. TaxID=82 RepID=UPI003D0B1D63